MENALSPSGDIIKLFLNRKKKSTPLYSLRALARDIKVSPSFLSEVISGKKRLGLDRVDLLGKVLDMDLEALTNLKRHYVPSPLQEAGLAKRPQIEPQCERVPKSQFKLLRQWFYPALMDLTTCADFNGSSEEISTRLGIRKEAAEIAVRELHQAGALIVADGKIRKADNVMKFTSHISRSEFRNFHAQMLKKFLRDLPRHSEEREFQKNLVLGISVAVRPEKLEYAKRKLSECLLEVAQELSAGDCTEVYHLSLQLFPLTKPK